MSAGFQQIFDIVFYAVIALVIAAGTIYGGYQLWDGFTGGSPESKRNGFVALLAGIIAGVVLYAIKGIAWGMVATVLPA